MNLFSIEEFTAKRHTAQTDLEEALRDEVERAVDLGMATSGWDELMDEVEDLYHSTYAEESGDGPHYPLHAGWKDELRKTLQKSTRDEHTVDRITVWLATWILSQATMAAAVTDDEELWVEWVDMGDKNVRPAHKAANGQQRPVGEMFDVDGVEMPYPGWPGAPIDLWINCRCTLRPVLAGEEALVASIEMREVSTEERKKDADAGRALPDGSYPIDNCSDLKNAIQAIGRAKDPTKTKAHIRKRKSALGCPDVELPDSWALTAAADDVSNSTVVVALPAEGAIDVGEEQKHLTLAFLGDGYAEVESLMSEVEGIATDYKPFTAAVSGHAVLGPNKAKVLIVEALDIETVRRELMAIPGVAAQMGQYAHPHFVPHVTIGYEDEYDLPELSEITFDRLAVWHGEQQTEYALGGADMEPEKTDAPPVEAATQVGTAEEYLQVDDDGKPVAISDGLVPWHGVITTEGQKSGDGRGFRLQAMRTRPTPLPLGFQKVSTPGHQNAVTVARIDSQVRVPIEEGKAEIRAVGFFRQTPEADEAIGLMADFDGRFGVSVDADESTFELDEDDETVWFSDARSCGACIVPIPAFAEAWVALGPAPEGFMDGEELTAHGSAVEEKEALVASAAVVEFVDVAPGRTEDGPGWLTHPEDTDRLRDYWTKGPGAAKIGWGTPGDFNRCRVNVAEYIKPQHLNGYCANRHYDALGFWPGEGPHNGKTVSLADELPNTERAELITLTASTGPRAPAAWFKDPEFEMGDERLVKQKGGLYACPPTITDEGQVFGHLAYWGQCHIGYPGQCMEPPKSASNYAHFLLGQVYTDEGPIPCGSLTIGGGHASHRLSAQAAMAHYDSTSTAWADVNVGQDEFGIWYAGWVRPGVPEEMVVAARASKVSGDWREIGTSPELIAALSVNVPGFPISRIAASVRGERVVALTAAGVVENTEEPIKMDAEQIEQFADAVAAAIEARAQRRARMAALAARYGKAAD